MPAALTLYSWGFEPYNNILSPENWVLIKKTFQKQNYRQCYWFCSCLLLHIWFVGGIATVAVGLEKPSYYVLAACSFSASHVARALAAIDSVYNKLSFLLELAGIGASVACVVSAFLNNDTLGSTIWIIVGTFERITHIPGCLKGDTSGFLSYDQFSIALASVASVEASTSNDLLALQRA